METVDEHDGERGDGDEDGHGADAVEDQEPEGVAVLLVPVVLRVRGPPLFLDLGFDARRLVGDLGVPGGSCLLYTSPSPRDKRQSRMPSSA